MCKMQLPYTFFSYGILECCSWNSQMAVLNHSKYIPSTYQVIYTQYTIMYIHNIQQMVSTSVLVSVHDRVFLFGEALHIHFTESIDNFMRKSSDRYIMLFPRS